MTVFLTKNRGDRERSPRFVFSKLFLCGLVVEDHLWSKDYPVTIGEQVPVDAIALIGNAVQAIGILDQPRAILPTYPSVQARNALRWHLYIVSSEAANSQHRFVEWIHSDDLPIDLDPHASTLRSSPVSIAIASQETTTSGCHRYRCWPG
jgi:hypothetical protein